MLENGCLQPQAVAAWSLLCARPIHLDLQRVDLGRAANDKREFLRD
jgi:hypothetical protein